MRSEPFRPTCPLALALLAVLFATQATALAAQNLLTNSDFASSLAGWQAGDGTVWDGARDAGGSPASGSAKGGATFSLAAGAAVVVTQCFDLTGASTAYVLRGKVFLPASQAGRTAAFLSVGFFPDPGCGGVPFPGPGGLTDRVTATNVWLPASATVGVFGRSAMVAAFLVPLQAGTVEGNFDDITFQPAASACLPDSQTLCLLAGRFRVTATFDAGYGNAGTAHSVQLTSDAGYLWFFDSANVEAIVKIVDGCGLGGHYWFFAAGLTNVKVVITVTDTATGAVRTYSNPANTPFQPIQDTSAFSCG
jgi:hypothetical protein